MSLSMLGSFNLYYYLSGHTPRPVTDEADLIIAMNQLDNSDVRQVAYDEIDDIKVSTVFLVINHQYKSGSPILFETKVWADDFEYIVRYSTWEIAEAYHHRLVDYIKQKGDLLKIGYI